MTEGFGRNSMAKPLNAGDVCIRDVACAYKSASVNDAAHRAGDRKRPQEGTTGATVSA
jgi:hypothetical protein